MQKTYNCARYSWLQTCRGLQYIELLQIFTVRYLILTLRRLSIFRFLFYGLWEIIAYTTSVQHGLLANMPLVGLWLVNYNYYNCLDRATAVVVVQHNSINYNQDKCVNLVCFRRMPKNNGNKKVIKKIIMINK